jgi:hypothetical protein
MKNLIIIVFAVLLSKFSLGQAGTFKLDFSIIGASGLDVSADLVNNPNEFSINGRVFKQLKMSLIKTDSVIINGDSVRGSIRILNYLVRFKGLAKNGTVDLTIISTKSSAVLGKLVSNNAKIEHNYSQIFDEVISKTEKHIFNPAYIQNKEWELFKDNLAKYGSAIKDDLEMFASFYLEAKKLPFSHFELTKKEGITAANIVTETYDDPKHFSLKQIDTETTLFKVGSFAGDGRIIDSLMKIVVKSNTKNLIIDVRDNSGGGAGVALELTKYLVKTKQPAGAIITRKWMNLDKGMPTESDYHQFKPFVKGSTKYLIDSIPTSLGFYLGIEPANKIFEGKVFVLTNNKTASTSEPFVQGLQLLINATVIGTKTAGEVLSKIPVVLDNGYVAFIPMADYITIDGKRLDKVGVNPDIATTAETALEKALEIIASKK